MTGDPAAMGDSAPAGHDGLRARSGNLPAVLAVDGGNSKTAVVLVAADGTLLASGTGPGVPEYLSDDTVRAIELAVDAAVTRAAAAAAKAAALGGPAALGRASALGSASAVGSAAAVGGPAAVGGAAAGRLPLARHLVACVANADLPEDEQRLTGMLQAQRWTETVEVSNDTFAVLRAGLVGAGPGAWGVAVTCGAGINCVGVAPDGRTARYLALGWESGDWGGGHGLGRAALWWAVRAEDGRGPQTRLRDDVAAQFGVPEVRDVAIGIHQGKLAEVDLVGLAPVLLRAAGCGDEVARGLVRRQAEEICVLACTAIRRLGLTAAPSVPVVLGGGLLAARDPLLTSWIYEAFAAAAPNATLSIVAVPPVAGAALIGLDHLGAGPSAEQRLRAAYPG